MPRLECVAGTSSKFYAVDAQGAQVTIQYGRIGTEGRTEVKQLSSPAAAAAFVDKTLADKRKKGYADAASSSGRKRAAPAAASPPAKRLRAAAGNAAKAAPAARAPKAAPAATVAGGRGPASDNVGIVGKIALAHSWKESIDPSGYLLSEKLDGMRAYWDGRGLWTRTGKPVIAPSWFTSALPARVELDGELFLGRGKFQELMTIVRRNDAPDTWRRVKYVVFDAPATAGGLEARMRAATRAAGKVGHVQIHPQVVCRGHEHLQKELKKVEAAKGEGLILRAAKAEHVAGRTWDLLKVKSAHDDEAIVTGYEKGKGKHVGSTGALICRSRTGKTFKVGTGLSDAERKAPPKVGTVITFKYNELTNDGIPRFPAYVRPRPDVAASEFA